MRWITDLTQDSPLPRDSQPPGAPRIPSMPFPVNSIVNHLLLFPAIYRDPNVQWGPSVSLGAQSSPPLAGVVNGSNVFDNPVDPSRVQRRLLPPAPPVRRCGRALPGTPTAEPAPRHNAVVNGGRPVAAAPGLGNSVLQASAPSTNPSLAGSSPTTEGSPLIVTPTEADSPSHSDLASQRALRAIGQRHVDRWRASPDRHEQQAAFVEVINARRVLGFSATWEMVLARIQSVCALPLDKHALELFWKLYDQYRDQLARADDLNGRSTDARDYHICEPTSDGWFGRNRYGESLNSIDLEWALATGGGPLTSPSSTLQYLLGTSLGFNRPPDHQTPDEPSDEAATQAASPPPAMSSADQQPTQNRPDHGPPLRPLPGDGHTGAGPAQPRDPAVGAGPVPTPIVPRGSDSGAAPAGPSSEEAVRNPGPNEQPHEGHRAGAGSPDSRGSRATRNSRSSRGSSRIHPQAVRQGDFSEPPCVFLVESIDRQWVVC